MELTAPCAPKLNLYLRVVGRRSDGYHELETIFQALDGGDTLTVRPAGELTLACDDPELPVDGSNLVLKAASALRDFIGRDEWGAAFDLRKRIPSGAGLGGGSSNAAGALLLLNRLWRLGLDRESLAVVAARVGSDVPFFLYGGAAAATGRGEKLRPIRTSPLCFVILKPAVSVSTPWAYGRWQKERCAGPSLGEFESILARGDPAEVAAGLRNDLEPGVAEQVPEISRCREWLLAAGALGARMTGSGSAVFGIAGDASHAERIAGWGRPPGQAWVASANQVRPTCDPHG